MILYYTMKQLRLISFVFLLFYLGTLAHGYTCAEAISNNKLNSSEWTSCFEASDGNIIGYAVGSLSSGPWAGQSASWDKNYNSGISWIDNPINLRQYYDLTLYENCYYDYPFYNTCTYPCSDPYYC